MLLPGLALAESFLGFHYLDSVSDIEKQYPGYSLTELNVPTAGKNQRIYYLRGAPVSGRVFLEFIDTRTELKEDLVNAEKHEQKIVSKILVPHLKSQLAEPPKNNFLLYKIKWQPEKEIPLKSLYEKFGTPNKRHISQSFVTILDWSQGVRAALSPDEMHVSSVEYLLQAGE